MPRKTQRKKSKYFKTKKIKGRKGRKTRKTRKTRNNRKKKTEGVGRQPIPRKSQKKYDYHIAIPSYQRLNTFIKKTYEKVIKPHKLENKVILIRLSWKQKHSLINI